MSHNLHFTHDIYNLEELREFWAALLPRLNSRCLLLMSGEVGAGKTTSVQMMADILGMRDVQSPSFAIHLRYQNAAGKSMDHVDLYRIEDDDDLESSGFWDLFNQKESLIVIEWANRLNPDFLPLDWQKIKIEIAKLGENSRTISVQKI